MVALHMSHGLVHRLARLMMMAVICLVSPFLGMGYETDPFLVSRMMSLPRVRRHPATVEAQTEC